MTRHARWMMPLIAVWWGYSGPALAQGNVPRWLVDAPTAGMLPSGRLSADLRLYGDSGILSQIEVGVHNRASIGASFGGQHLVGSRDAAWNPRVEVAGRVRVIEEEMKVPAVAVGYHSQGYGEYDRELKRYAVKSKGIYAVASKNYGFPLGDMGLHVGLNRSLEDGDGDGDISGFVGADVELKRVFALLMEYDFAINDNDDNSLGSGRGRLNVGGRWMPSERLNLEVDVKNLFRDGKRTEKIDRQIRLVYYTKVW